MSVPYNRPFPPGSPIARFAVDMCYDASDDDASPVRVASRTLDKLLRDPDNEDLRAAVIEFMPRAAADFEEFLATEPHELEDQLLAHLRWISSASLLNLSGCELYMSALCALSGKSLCKTEKIFSA